MSSFPAYNIPLYIELIGLSVEMSLYDWGTHASRSFIRGILYVKRLEISPLLLFKSTAAATIGIGLSSELYHRLFISTKISLHSPITLTARMAVRSGISLMV